MIARLGNGAAGLAQAGVIDRHAHQAAATIGQGTSPHTRKQGSAVSQRQREWRKYSLDQLRCWRPWVQMMRDRQRRPTQTKAPRAWRVARRKVRRLGKTGSPVGDDLGPGGEECHRASGRKAKVFLPLRRKRSPAGNFSW